MMFVRLFSTSALALGLTVSCADFQPGAETANTESETQSIIGGNPVLSLPFTGTARLQIQPLDDSQGMPRDPVDCSGSLVAPNLVLTSARCVEFNLDPDTGAYGGTITVGFGPDGTEPAGGIMATDVELHRYFTSGGGVAQLGLINLATDAPGQFVPVELNTDPVTAGMVTIVGYGKEDDNGSVGVRRGVEVQLAANQITDELFTVGDASATSCDGDGGAPVFADLGNGQVQVGVTQFQASCQGNHARTRVDRYITDFLHPYIDRFNGPCLVDATCETVGCRTPDPDCAGNECEWGNVCEENCPDGRDWDCDLGSFIGEVCDKATNDNGDCEEEGSCVAAEDDASFEYCTRPCDPMATNPCPENMRCELNSDTSRNECVFNTPSPGSQNFPCAIGDECRSGICEDRICVNECDISAPDCPADTECLPSQVQPGTNVCRGENLSGGGGFCSAGGTGSGTTALLVLLALVGIGFGRRKNGAFHR